MHYEREFRIATPKEVRETATEVERLLINTIATNANRYGIRVTYADVLAVLETRPSLVGSGLLEYQYSWKTRKWAKSFQRGKLRAVLDATGFSRAAVAPCIIAESDRTGRNMTFDECVAFIQEKKAGVSSFSKSHLGDIAGETFGVWIVDEKGVYRARLYNREQLVVDVSCRSCGHKKTFRASDLRSGEIGRGGCPHCRCALRKCRANSSTACDSAIMRQRIKREVPTNEQLYSVAVGWFTRTVGTAEFIENYCDAVGNVEARAIWTSIHGEML